MAILVNQKVRGVTWFRVIFFIPVVTSIVVISILWDFMYQGNGLVNSMIDTLTFGAFQGTDWLSNTDTALGAIIVLSIWQAVGFHMIIWLSGLQTIPEELYEAARMDGANAWQQFLNVTWPGLRSTMVFVLVTITIAGPRAVRAGRRHDAGRSPATPPRRSSTTPCARATASRRRATARRSRSSSSSSCSSSRSSSGT